MLMSKAGFKSSKSKRNVKSYKGKLPPYIRFSEKGVFLNVKVRPRAPKNTIKGVQGNLLKIDINAPPVDGEANKELIKFLSKKLKIPKQDIEIKSGNSSKEKLIILKNKNISDISHIF